MAAASPFSSHILPGLTELQILDLIELPEVYMDPACQDGQLRMEAEELMLVWTSWSV